MLQVIVFQDFVLDSSRNYFWNSVGSVIDSLRGNFSSSRTLSRIIFETASEISSEFSRDSFKYFYWTSCKDSFRYFFKNFSGFPLDISPEIFLEAPSGIDSEISLYICSAIFPRIPPPILL